MDGIAISAKNLSKKYRLYDSPQRRLKEALHPLRKKYHREFWALRDVSFELKKGESLGIIGRNGSGKSTLLQILCGVLQPSEGGVQVSGSISALLELGAGFNPDFTGRQNVYLNGAIKGFTKEQIDDRLEAIFGFADIGEFIDQPVKTYSSGMYVRLAFAAAINIDPDILVVDEALSVGDMFFQAKCMTRIKKMIDSGVTLLFVSHDLSSIKSLCKHSLWLQNGLTKALGDSGEVALEYGKFLIDDVNAANIQPKKVIVSKLPDTPLSTLNGISEKFARDDFLDAQKHFRSGTGAAKFKAIEVSGENDEPINNSMVFDQRIKIKVYIEFFEDYGNIAVGYHIRNKQRQEIIGHDSFALGTDIYKKKFRKGDRLAINFITRLPLQHGVYNINLLISSFTDQNMFSDVVFLDWIENAYIFEMRIRESVPVWDFVQIPVGLDYEISG